MTDTIETLREVTDTALDAARAALTEGWQRLSATDIDPATHGQDVGAEMGALTLPLGTITRIRRRRHNTGRVLDRINDYDAEAREREEQAQGARDRRDELIREALEAGTSAATIADILDMHVQRIYQIKRGER